MSLSGGIRGTDQIFPQLPTGDGASVDLGASLSNFIHQRPYRFVLLGSKGGFASALSEHTTLYHTTQASTCIRFAVDSLKGKARFPEIHMLIILRFVEKYLYNMVS